MSDDSSSDVIQQTALAPAATEAEPFQPLAQGSDGPLRLDSGDGVAPGPRADEPPIRVMALHALGYCERLFYLEEVEEIRVADAAVYAGRRLHDDITSLDDETPERRQWELASERWGVFGKLDAVRRRDGAWVSWSIS